MEDRMSNNPSVLNVTKELIVLYNYNDCETDLMKVLKQLFFGQSAALHYFNKPLFTEPVEAWEHGPVVSTVYSTWRKKLETILDTSNRDVNDFERFVLDMIFNITKDYDPMELSNITHMEGGAWRQVYIPSCNIKIPNKLIKSCFKVHKEILDKTDEYIEKHSEYDEEKVDSKIKDFSFLND